MHFETPNPGRICSLLRHGFLSPPGTGRVAGLQAAYTKEGEDKAVSQNSRSWWKSTASLGLVSIISCCRWNWSVGRLKSSFHSSIVAKFQGNYSMYERWHKHSDCISEIEQNADNVAEELISRNKIWISLKINLKNQNMSAWAQSGGGNIVTFLHQRIIFASKHATGTWHLKSLNKTTWPCCHEPNFASEKDTTFEVSHNSAV